MEHCHLCKSKLDETQERSRYARLRNELEVQLKESRALQKERYARRSTLAEQLGKYQRVRKLLSEELLDRSRHYLTEADAKIDELTRTLGFLDRELIDLERERKLASEVSELSDRKKALNAELSSLSENIAAWTANKERRQSQVYALISKLTAAILEQDIPSDIESVTEQGVRFDFADNNVVINDKRSYSASSQAVIKNAFHLAMLFASCLVTLPPTSIQF